MTTRDAAHHSRRPAAVIFDMDGLLLDSERLARDLFVAACREFDFEPNLDVYQRCIGATYAEGQAILQQGLGPDFPSQQVHERWDQRYREHIDQHPVDLKPGAIELLDSLHAAGVGLALATSSLRVVADTKMRLAGLDHFFSHRVCGGEARRGKPHPDPYLKACELLNVSPQGCWALEDSMNGTRSALAAGLVVFQIPDLIEPQGTERQLGQEILPSLHHLLDRWNQLQR